MLDLERTLQKIKDKQWALADIDWDAPGADTIRADQRDDLKAFLADLVWIEHVGARGFAALATKAKDPVLAEIYRWFHAEEQRHANAELALMRRWGMIEQGETPPVNKNIRLVIDYLDKHAGAVQLGTLTTVIAMLETALDGALIKFLLDEVSDPVCHEVFKHINSDESRHLAVDFHVMEQMGMRPQVRETLSVIAGALRPQAVLGVLVYLPLLNRMRDNIVGLGLEERKLYAAIERFDEVGSRSEHTKKYAPFRVLRWHGRMVTNRKHPYHLLADGLVKATNLIPSRVLGPLPSWVDELTAEPVA
jgi:hypothetical protein